MFFKTLSKYNQLALYFLLLNLCLKMKQFAILINKWLYFRAHITSAERLIQKGRCVITKWAFYYGLQYER